MYINDLPDSVFLFGVVPHLDITTLLTLRSVSGRFQAIVDDESVWRRKVAADFNFPLATTARAHTSNSWRLLYKGLKRSNVYLWGQNTERWRGHGINQGRLALSNLAGAPELLHVISSLEFSVPIPLRLNLGRSGCLETLDPQNRFAKPATEEQLEHLGSPVSLTASGFGFAALTSTGQVLGWGRLRNGFDGNLSSATILNTCIPSSTSSYRIRAISTGRQFLAALATPEDYSGELDSDKVLVWEEWGQPYWITYAAGIPSVDDDGGGHGLSVTPHDYPVSSTSDTHRTHKKKVYSRRILQVEAGWDFFVTLVSVRVETARGYREVGRQIWFWDLESLNAADDDLLRPSPQGVSPVKPRQLPALNTNDRFAAESENEAEVITEVAAGAGFVMALTSAGTIYQLPLVNVRFDENDGLHVEAEWQRMNHFDDMELVSELLVDALTVQRVGDISNARITHISAHFLNFAAYSVPIAPKAQAAHAHYKPLPGENDTASPGGHSGLVLLGKTTENQPIPAVPVIIPELQGLGVIKVSFGDWHSSALTDAGQVFSWGGWQDGALGIFDAFPPDERPWDEGKLLELIHKRKQPGFASPSRPILERLLNRQAQTSPGALLLDRDAESSEEDQLLLFLLRRLRSRSIERSVSTPTRVYFDDDLDPETSKVTHAPSSGSFAFDIAMGGWHSGALVLDRPYKRGSVLTGSSVVS